MDIDDPMLGVMAEIISLPQKMALQMATTITAQHIEAKAAMNRAEYNAKVANDQVEFLRAQRAQQKKLSGPTQSGRLERHVGRDAQERNENGNH